MGQRPRRAPLWPWLPALRALAYCTATCARYLKALCCQAAQDYRRPRASCSWGLVPHQEVCLLAKCFKAAQVCVFLTLACSRAAKSMCRAERKRAPEAEHWVAGDLAGTVSRRALSCAGHTLGQALPGCALQAALPAHTKELRRPTSGARRFCGSTWRARRIARPRRAPRRCACATSAWARTAAPPRLPWCACKQWLGRGPSSCSM